MNRTWIFSQRCYIRMVWMWKVLCVVAADGLSQIWTLRTLIGALNAFAGGLPGLQDMRRIKCISIDDFRCHKVNLTGTCEIVGMKWQAARDFDLLGDIILCAASNIRWSDPRTQPVYSGSMWLYINFIQLETVSLCHVFQPVRPWFATVRKYMFVPITWLNCRGPLLNTKWLS